MFKKMLDWEILGTNIVYWLISFVVLIGLVTVAWIDINLIMALSAVVVAGIVFCLCATTIFLFLWLIARGAEAVIEFVKDRFFTLKIRYKYGRSGTSKGKAR